MYQTAIDDYKARMTSRPAQTQTQMSEVVREQWKSSGNVSRQKCHEERDWSHRNCGQYWSQNPECQNCLWTTCQARTTGSFNISTHLLWFEVTEYSPARTVSERISLVKSSRRLDTNGTWPSLVLFPPGTSLEDRGSIFGCLESG